MENKINRSQLPPPPLPICSPILSLSFAVRKKVSDRIDDLYGFVGVLLHVVFL